MYIYIYICIREMKPAKELQLCLYENVKTTYIIYIYIYIYTRFCDVLNHFLQVFLSVVF